MSTAHLSGFVGGDLGDSPYISDFGAFLRVVRLNRLRPRDYFSAFGLRVRRADDLSKLLTFSPARRETFWRAMATPPPLGAAADVWIPAQGASQVLQDGWVFRFCPECIRSSYHCNLMQMPWLERCPMHGSPLTTACPRCDMPVDPTGERGAFLLTCACGHDLVDERFTCKGNRHLMPMIQRCIWPYLSWSTEARLHHFVVAPQQEIDLMPLVDLMAIPESIVHATNITLKKGNYHACHLVRRDSAGINDAASAIARLECLSSDDPGIVEMPNAMLPGLRAVAAEIIGNMPDGTLSEGELALFMGAGVELRKRDQRVAKRRSLVDIAYLPPHRVADRHFLSFCAIDRHASRTAYRVLEIALGPLLTERLRLPSAQGCYQLALAAVETILLRAYSEGMRTVLARYIPGIGRSRSMRARLTNIWTVIEKHDVRLSSIRVHWLSRRSASEALTGRNSNRS